MSSKPELVPEAPLEPVVIPSVDMKKIEAWVAYFKAMSQRIHVLRPSDDNFDHFCKVAEEKLRLLKSIENHYTIVDWPKAQSVAFVIVINLAPPGAVVTHFEIEGSFFFCLGKKAFGVTYFEWDGDGEANHFPTTYSLYGHYQERALSWEYVSGLIANRIKELEDQVPNPPVST